MDYSKVPQEINNMTSDNVKLLAKLFPAAVKDGQVDFEALKEELGQFEEVGKEKYELTWAGKQDTKKLAQEDVYNRTLKYIEADSKNADTTENLYIEGDNLEVLKLLRQNYYGAIKMIYIDPPYNTGNDFVYNDKFAMDGKESDIAEGASDDEGNPLQRNQQSSNRYHANWLNMMYPRLKVAKDLLTDDGAIFISIDDNEVQNLRKLLDEVLGVDNFIGGIANINNPKGRSDDKYIATAHEYLLVYAKNISSLVWYGFEPTEEITRRYNKTDEKERKYREIDLRKTGENDLREDRPNLFYYFHYNEQTGEFYPSRDRNAPLGFTSIFPQREDGKEGNWRWGLDTAEKQITDLVAKFMPTRKVWGIMQKDYLEGRGLVKPTSSWTFKDVNSERGTEQFIDLGFDKRIFPKPKPLGTIERVLRLSTSSDDIALDFFSGSASTVHAIMELNAEDGGNRKFIMIQVPEKTDENSEAYKAGYPNICEIGKERIRRAGEKIKQEIKTANAQLKMGEEPKQVPDIGFKVFRTGDTNIKWNLIDTLGQLSTEEMAHTPDLADFTQGFTDIDVVYEVMLRQKDVPLSSILETLTDIGSRTYLYGSTYLVCLETVITEILIDKLAALDPLPIKFIFRDSAFKDDINLKDETFRRLKNLIERNSGVTKQTYTVEFI